ncbi:hypothetical protein ACWD5Q_10695 [Streptomyces sp. NPDC002513]
MPAAPTTTAAPSSASPAPPAHPVATADSDFQTYCAKSGPSPLLTGQPAYGGKGPHPVLIAAQGDTELIAVTASPIPSAGSSIPPDDTYRPLPEKAQLVACVGKEGTGPLLETCRYLGHGDDYIRYWRQGKYRVTVYEARSGRKIGTTRISGADHFKCDPSLVFFGSEDHTETILTEPTRAEFKKVLARWVEADR